MVTSAPRAAGDGAAGRCPAGDHFQKYLVEAQMKILVSFNELLVLLSRPPPPGAAGAGAGAG